MLSSKFVLYFLRPFFGANRELALSGLLLALCFNLVFNSLPARADEPDYITVQESPVVSDLKSQLNLLQIQDNILADLQTMFAFQDEQILDGTISQSLFQDEKTKLDTKRAELAEAESKLQSQIQSLEKRLKNYAVAEKVRSALNFSDYHLDRYDRIGYWFRTYSDCTWYAAEALKLASAGKIDLNNRDSVFGNWGNAGRWATHAAEFASKNPGGPIRGVDKIPTPGDLAEWPDHLAFVEKVQDIKDEQGNLVHYTVTISEEIATGIGRKDSVPVKPDDDASGKVKRWRIILEFNVKDNQEADTPIKFIHFDLNK